MTLLCRNNDASPIVHNIVEKQPTKAIFVGREWYRKQTYRIVCFCQTWSVIVKGTPLRAGRVSHLIIFANLFLSCCRRL